jgi:hypothetical protein
MSDKSLLLELNNLNGEYQLNVDGLLHVYSNINYSNVIFDNLQIQNNANICGSLTIYNNMLVSGIDSNIISSSMYSVTSPGVECSGIVDEWTSNTATWSSNTATWTSNNIGLDPLTLNTLYVENIFNSSSFFGKIIESTQSITGSNIIIKSPNSTHSYSLAETIIPVEYPGVPLNNQAALQLKFQNDENPDNAGTSHWFYQSGLAFKRNNEASWNVISDVRLKTDINPLNDGLKTLCSLNPVYYKWKKPESKNNRINPGFIAQEYAEILPDQVNKVKLYGKEKDLLQDDDTCLTISYDLNAYLVAAIKELYEIVQQLKDEIVILKTTKADKRSTRCKQ